MKTAVEWLADQLKQQGFLYDLDIEAAKQMEKEQIIDFAMQMHKIDCSNTGTDILREEAEQHYNEIFNKK